MTPLGQYMELKMTIDDVNTRFELTGPDYSWFAFGFDTTTMAGYSLIIQGLDDDRTALEQNLLDIGDPGVPQVMQDITIVNTLHDAANDLTTIIIERANQTGDTNDPVFTTNMTELDVIWAYSAASTPEFPSPNLGFHGFQGRGTTMITFAPIPEPGSVVLLATSGVAALWFRRRR